MRKSTFRYVVIIVSSLLVTACQTTGSVSNQATYNVLFSPGDHIKQLLGESKIDQASQVYEGHKAYFAAGTPKRRVVLEELSLLLKSRYEPGVVKALSNVRAISPSDPKSWGRVKSVLREGEDVVARIRRHQILESGTHRIDISTLDNEVNQLRSAFKNGAQSALKTYDVAAAENFFNRYPIDLSPRTFLVENGEIWNAHIDSANEEGLRHIYRTYSDQLPSTEGSRIAQLHYRRILERLSPDKKPNINAIVQAAVATKEADLPLDTVPDSNVALIEVTSHTLLKDGQIEFPVGISIDMPFNATWDDVYKTTVLLKDRKYFDDLGKVRTEFLPNKEYVSTAFICDLIRVMSSWTSGGRLPNAFFTTCSLLG